MAAAPVGLLDGVATTIKDVVLTKGWPTRKGSRTISIDGFWTEDSPFTARLREHNAVILGKTTTPEFGWKALGDSPIAGITRNP
jgi:aspartyl-tRNA(Asn)/glutamyl-tRNA(Gln) amidotransferase subunit A